MKPIQILIYEDNALLRESLEQLVGSFEQLQFLASFEHVRDIEKQLLQFKPDLILMDIEMPGQSGIEALRKLRQTGVQTPVLMLTVFDDNGHVLDAVKAGASGYLLKKHLGNRLLSAIEEIMEGGAPMSPSVARMVIEAMHQTPKKTNPYQLTTREKEILTSLSKGNSYKMVAAEFGISIDTVRTHIRKIYDKLQVHSQTEAVTKAIFERLL